MEKARILIVDDEDDFLHFMKLNLEKTGKYKVRAIADPLAAIAAAETFKPDLAVLDIMMPGMDGGELAWQLRNNEETKDMPVIFLTALLNSREERSMINTRSVFMAKPVSIEELMKKIDGELGIK